MATRDTANDSALYDEGYFELGVTSNYKGYLWRPEIVRPRARAIVAALHLAAPTRILDFGCAKGHYVKAFRELGLEAEGVDISSYAVKHAPDDVRAYIQQLDARPLRSISSGSYDLVLAKDVLEHVREEELAHLVSELRRIGRGMLVTVPIVSESGDYTNVADRMDQTHRIRWTCDRWLRLLGGTECQSGLCLALKGANAVGTLCARCGCAEEDEGPNQ